MRKLCGVQRQCWSTVLYVLMLVSRVRPPWPAPRAHHLQCLSCEAPHASRGIYVEHPHTETNPS